LARNLKIIEFTAVFSAMFLIIMFSLIFIISMGGIKKSEGVEFVIGMSQANLTEPWRISMNEEIVNEAKKYNNLKVIYKDAGGDTNRQKKDIEDLMDSDIDLLIVSFDDTKELTPLVSKAYKSIPVIVLDRAIEGFDYTLYIGPDNVSIGRQAGELASELIGEKQGKVIEVQGMLNSPPAVERSKGFKDVLKNYKNIDISWTVIGEWQRDETEDKLTEILMKEKDIDVIFAHNDYMALGAYRAAYKLGIKDIKVIGVDGLPGANGGLDLVDKGFLQGTFTCQTGGKEAIEYAMKILNKKEDIPKRIILNSNKIIKENLNNYFYISTNSTQNYGLV
jgi:ABC-type sugar transport system substrate-binding protein